MPRTLVWISALHGPAPQLCDDEAMLTVEKYERVLARHSVPDECAGCTLDALAVRFPYQQVKDNEDVKN